MVCTEQAARSQVVCWGGGGGGGGLQSILNQWCSQDNSVCRAHTARCRVCMKIEKAPGKVWEGCTSPGGSAPESGSRADLEPTFV